MILVDTNLLIYAAIEEMPQHEQTRSWLDEKINAPGRVGMPWLCLLGFVRLATNRRVFEDFIPMMSAWATVEHWLGADTVWIPEPTSRHQEILRGLLDGLGGKPNLVPHAHLAALAIEHGLTLCSADRDFARFPQLRWENPLQA